ncbi:MAG: hypothetical protein WC867_08430 [Candidatus Pacearchaeota archaeon]|jgi:hypothetical protein
MEEPKFTTSSDIIRYENSTKLGPYERVKVLDTTIEDMVKRDDLFKMWRGQMINNSLSVEEKLEYVIIRLLFRKELCGAELFKNLILSKEFFGFMNKLKVFKDLLRNIDKFKEKDYTELFGSIQFIIEERNRFAHGRVTYSGLNGEKVFLEFSRGKIVKEEITEETMDKFKQKCLFCYKELDKLYDETNLYAD